MKIRHVIAAVEVIIDKDLPVTIERIAPPLRPVEVTQIKPAHSADEIGAEKVFERRTVPIEFDEHPVFPDRGFDWRKTVRRAIEVADAGEIRRPAKFTFERVSPAVIRAAQVARLAFGGGQDGGGMVATNVEEAAQNMIVASDYQERLSGQLPRDVLARLADLLGAPNKLPGTRKDRPPLQFHNPRIHVPGRRDRPCLGQRRIRIVTLYDLLD